MFHNIKFCAPYTISYYNKIASVTVQRELAICKECHCYCLYYYFL